MSISFAVTAWNEMSEGRGRGQKILACILAATIGDRPIDDIVVVDDGSQDVDALARLLRSEPKVRLVRNAENLGVFGNKLEAIARCTSDWVVNCDSDNVMDANYLDMADHQIRTYVDRENTWYCPSFARPEFDYRGLVGRWDLANIEELLAKPLAECALNTGNQIVHRESFMKVFGGYRGRRFDLMQPNYLDLPTSKRTTHRHRLVYDAKDSLIFNMEWLFADGVLEIVPGLEYEHYYTSGAESNYARAPDEKDQLNDVLIAELRKRSREEQGNRVKRGEYNTEGGEV